MSSPASRARCWCAARTSRRAIGDCPRRRAQAIDADGWFHTGDAGFFDEEGFLTISDRIKDMIISGGENIYPAEVESALMRHPAIAEVAVIGEPRRAMGRGCRGDRRAQSGQTLTIEELRAFAGESLARYKLPRRLETLAALPRNATGKILKYRLREMFATEPPNLASAAAAKLA